MKSGRTAGIREVGGEGRVRCGRGERGLIRGRKVTREKGGRMGEARERGGRGEEMKMRVEDGQKIQVEEVKA